jgi:hypothetical protein
MNKLTTVAFVLFVLLGLHSSVFASTTRSEEALSGDNFEVDGSLGPASGPGDYKRGFGVNFGAGYALSTIDRNLQARVDLSFYQFNYDFHWGSGSYTRIPVTISGRYYLPIINRLKAFGQAGLEMSVDTYDTAAHERKNEMNLGISPGAGIEFFINRNASIFALGRFHLLPDSYLSMQFGVASHF